MNITGNNKNNFLNSIFTFIKYSLIGFLNLIIDFIVLMILSFITGVTNGIFLALINFISFVIYSLNGFFMNSKFTFKTAKKSNNTKEKILHYIKYASVLGIANIINSIILITLTSKNPLISGSLTALEIDSLNKKWLGISKLIASITTGIFSFLINKFFIFKNKQK